MRYMSTVTITHDDGTTTTVPNVEPDVADNIVWALRGEADVRPPGKASTVPEIVPVLSQVSRLLAHFEVFRELAIIKADESHAYADRKAIGTAAAMPATRLYRILEKYGRPRKRAAE